MEETNKQAVSAAPAEAVQETKVNKKLIYTIAIIVLAVVAIGLIMYWSYVSASKEADEAIALADIEQNDSVALARYIDAAKLDHKSGNRAKLMAAIRLYQKGEYQQAIDYLDDASTDSDIAEAGKYSLMGDCYVNLENYDKALDCYRNAISEADNNPQIVPFILVKEANIYRAQGKYNDEYEAYKKIYTEYPEYANNLNFDIRKYAERAKQAAAK